MQRIIQANYLFYFKICALSGFNVTHIIHTATQDGKDFLDAHFGVAGRQILEWVRQGNNCTTPAMIVMALLARVLKGCLSNTFPMLLQIEREFRDVLESFIKEDLSARVMKILSHRYADVEYHYDVTCVPRDLSRLPHLVLLDPSVLVSVGYQVLKLKFVFS